MNMSAKERKEYDDKLESVRHSLKRFVNIQVGDLRERQQKHHDRNEDKHDELKDLLNKMYLQSVETHLKLENLEKDVEKAKTVSKELVSYKQKMRPYEFIIDNKAKVMLTIPLLIGFYKALKPQIHAYFIELIKLWK